jgi:uncharacterized membrane protein
VIGIICAFPEEFSIQQVQNIAAGSRRPMNLCMGTPFMKTRRLLLVVLLIAVTDPAAVAEVRYSIGQLPPPAGALGVEATSVNDRGQVVGVARFPQGAVRPVLWEDGVPTLIEGAPPTQSGSAEKINNRGSVAINWWDEMQSYRINVSGADDELALRPLSSPGGAGVQGMNDNDHAVGFSLDETLMTHAVMWRSHAVVSLGVTGETGTMAWDIDNAGRIVGVRVAGGVGQPFRWHHGLLSWLAPLDDRSHAAAVAVNNHGYAVGDATTAEGRPRAVVWPDTHPRELGALPGHHSSISTDINDDNIIVGSSFTSDDSAAVLWEDGGIVELNDLIAPASGWRLHHAAGINNIGQIIGRGTYDGQEAVYLLTPVPEPGLSVLMVAGGMLLGRGRRSASRGG